MTLYYLALSILLASGLASLLAGRSRAANAIGPVGVALGCVVGLGFALGRLAQGANVLTSAAAWNLPVGQWALRVDGLSAFFLVPTFLLGGFTALYGRGAMSFYCGKKNLGAHWFFFALMLAAQAVVLAASDAVLFLGAWEVMSVAPFFLISFHDADAEVRSAAWTYLVAAHAGLAFLLLAMLLLGGGVSSFSFAAFAGSVPPGGSAVAVFLLCLAGFGVKAGLAPLHVWLPEAHPAAPSHVSAFLSGALIKAGVYGIVRTLTFLERAEPWQAYLLLGLGLVTALLGIVQAMGKRHLKRLLAYSSVENIGLMTMGLGLFWLGRSHNQGGVAALGLAGALLHVWAHALMKGSLFLAAGAVLHGAGTVMMVRLGGLMKRMPLTGRVFALGAAAICGLPPLAGFTGELLMYLGAGRLGLALTGPGALAAWVALTGMALVGGLAALVFTKAFGATFLGEPRSEAPSHAHDPSPTETAPMLCLAGLCLGLGLFSPAALAAMLPAVATVAGAADASGLVFARDALWALSYTGLGLVGLTGLAALARLALLRGKPVGQTGTWDCGYAEPTARMQYTPSSFSEPMIHLLGKFSGSSSRLDAPRGYFPSRASYSEAAPDVVRQRAFEPFFAFVDWLADHLKWLQHGNLNLYILYILLTLMALLAYNFLAP